MSAERRSWKGLAALLFGVGLLLVTCLAVTFIAAACWVGAGAWRDGQVRKPPAAATAVVPSGTPGAGNTVRVVASEFELALDSLQVPAGTVTFVVENQGQVPHDFRIRGDGVDERTPMLQPGESAQLTVELQPGTYSYECTVGGHARLGMQGELTVTGS